LAYDERTDDLPMSDATPLWPEQGLMPSALPRRLELLSVVAPIYNEEQTLPEFYSRVSRALEDLPFELVLVDDGSTDGSAEILARLASEDPRVRVLSLSRNFGHQNALTAGLDYASGSAVVMLDADLQDPPELILTMLDEWRKGSDVVYAVRQHREGESWFKLTTANWFYKLFGKLTQVGLENNSGDFRLLDRRPLDSLRTMRERSRFLRGMTVWVGYRQASVPYQRDRRYAGTTKYTLPKMLRFSVDAILSFSHRPLQLATLLGFGISTLAFLAIPVVIILRLLHSYLPGFGTVTIVILLLGGIQLIAIGIIGEYVGRIYDEVKGRPLYVVRGRLNIREAELPDGASSADAPPADSAPSADPAPPAAHARR
jgi:dolichol-phosphate mannosyltransferase